MQSIHIGELITSLRWIDQIKTIFQQIREYFYLNIPLPFKEKNH